jgi:hypothetical protein
MPPDPEGLGVKGDDRVGGKVWEEHTLCIKIKGFAHTINQKGLRKNQKGLRKPSGFATRLP